MKVLIKFSRSDIITKPKTKHRSDDDENWRNGKNGKEREGCGQLDRLVFLKLLTSLLDNIKNA